MESSRPSVAEQRNSAVGSRRDSPSPETPGRRMYKTGLLYGSTSLSRYPSARTSISVSYVVSVVEHRLSDKQACPATLASNAMRLAMKSDRVHQSPNGSTLVLPYGRSDSRDPLCSFDLTLVESLGRESSCRCVVFDGAGDDRVEFDFTSKVSREVGKVGSLLDDGTLGLCLVPPTEFGCVFTARRAGRWSDHGGEQNGWGSTTH